VNVGSGASEEQLVRENDGAFSYSLTATGIVTLEVTTSFFTQNGSSTNGNQFFGISAFDSSSNVVFAGDLAFGNASGQGAMRLPTGLVTNGAELDTVTGVGNLNNLDAGDLIRFRMTLDPTANSNDGSAFLEAYNLTDGGTFQQIIVPTNAGLTSLPAGYQTPDTWNGVFLRVRRNAAHLDDLTVIPEPGSFALLLAAGVASLVAFRRRRR
jgi:hypothetical protein